ncbi:TetR/AcrR family transcriptional regulator [Alicyclobacillus fastidiosus]|uniref:TetR/AcrR family transcriptional regulator n=1 Tax=Alicyclobacillus fastidiosus TaxID=392011 RepID=A0ABY6ZBP6_9BACL|nr:TetR family transcriptional regulator [Alicyclobacillus fastidiosus]WAH40305.1 TetR/AcrR family transcriptional regulator [Alicyclobacillus fastidiosus]GMA61684.1 TetR family transcriptional regulator [Alicyclobacillus fastidiosus]
MKSTGQKKGRAERRDAAENRQRILDAAIKLFEQHGVEQVSMNQIAMEGSGTLYRRYKNKSELCLDLIKDNIVLLFEDIDVYLKQHQTAPPRQRLKGVLSLFMRFRDKKLQLLTGVEEGALAGSHFQFNLHEIVVQLLNEMKTDEHTEPNTVFKADMLLMALRSDSYVFQRDVRGYSSESFLEQICLTFFPER